MGHVHQIRLVFHNLIDVLVGAWDFVDNAFVLTALDTLSLNLQIFFGEAFLCFGTTHASPRAVGARMK